MVFSRKQFLNRCVTMSLVGLALMGAGCSSSIEKAGEKAGGSERSMPASQPAEPFIEQIVAFETADAERMPEPGGILFVGSSTFRLWKTDVDFAGLPVINRGFGGSAMRHVNYYYDRIVVKYKPAVVAVYQGDNDIAGGQSPEAVMAEVKSFASRLRGDLPDVQLVFVPVKASASRLRFREQQDAFNGMLRGFAHANPSWVTYFDGAHLLLDDAGQPEPTYFRTDRLHLSQAGYDVWTAALKPVLMQALERSKATADGQVKPASDSLSKTTRSAVQSAGGPWSGIDS